MTDKPDVYVPDLSDALINALDAMFPERCADLGWSDREVWFEAGKREVVRFLREQHRRQNETILE